MKVEVIRAWPGRFESVWLDLPEGTCVGEAVARAAWPADAPSGIQGAVRDLEFERSGRTVAWAVFGQRVEADHVLRDGDRVEMLRPLQADPKDARRRRAGQQNPR